MPVQVGDLVGFYRRKSPGMGIILDKVDDVLDECGVDHDVAFQIAKNAEGRTYWEKREAVKDLCGGEYTEKPQMLKLFFQYCIRIWMLTRMCLGTRTPLNKQGFLTSVVFRFNQNVFVLSNV